MLAHILDLLVANEQSAIIVLGVIIAVLKAVPNSKAIPVIAQGQRLLDGVAKCVQVVADVLAAAIKSDGLLGKK